MTPLRPNGRTWDSLLAKDELDPDEARVDACFREVFSGPMGALALQYMHALTTFKRTPPGASDGALREDEAQRRFVAILEARIERAKKHSASKNVGRSESGTPERTRRSRRSKPA